MGKINIADTQGYVHPAGLARLIKKAKGDDQLFEWMNSQHTISVYQTLNGKNKIWGSYGLYLGDCNSFFMKTRGHYSYSPLYSCKMTEKQKLVAWRMIKRSEVPLIFYNDTKDIIDDLIITDTNKNDLEKFQTILDAVSKHITNNPESR